MMRQGYMVLMFQIFGTDSAKGANFMTTPHKKYFISCFVDRIASCNNLTNTTMKPFLYPQLGCSEGRIVTTRNFMPWSLALKRVPFHTACHYNVSSILLLKIFIYFYWNYLFSVININYICCGDSG